MAFFPSYNLVKKYKAFFLSYNLPKIKKKKKKTLFYEPKILKSGG